MREITSAWRQMGMAPLISVLFGMFFVYGIVFADHGHENGTYEEYVAGLNVVETDAGSMYFKVYLPETETDDGHDHVHHSDIKGTILLIHGVPTSSWMWRDVAGALSDEGYRVLVPDLIGYGASDKPTNDLSVYDAESQAVRISNLINILGINDFTLVTHDYGGVVAMELLDISPERIDHVIFQNALVQEFDAPAIPERGIKKRVVMWAYGCRITNPLVIGGILRKGDAGELEKDDRRGYTQPFIKQNQVALTQFFTGFESLFEKMPAYHRILAEYDGQVSSIWGIQDQFLDVAIHQEKIRALYPEAVHITHEEAGHYMALSHSELLVDDIINLIQQ